MNGHRSRAMQSFGTHYVKEHFRTNLVAALLPPGLGCGVHYEFYPEFDFGMAVAAGAPSRGAARVSGCRSWRPKPGGCESFWLSQLAPQAGGLREFLALNRRTTNGCSRATWCSTTSQCRRRRMPSRQEQS